MAVPSKQIGWTNESNLLWYIAKELEKLQCELCDAVIPGPQGPPGPAGSLTDAYHGSFLSVVDQSSTANVAKAMEYEVTELSNGVSIVNNGAGKATKITIANAGVYNIQFSAQLHNGDGGGSSVHADIWLAKGGIAVANFATKVSVTPNSPYVVAAWNFFADASAGDYYEIMWQPTITDLKIKHEAASGSVPVIPSLILTVNRIA